MLLKPNRIEKLVLVVPVWHIVVLAIVGGASAGIVASTTSVNRWVVWVITTAILWSLLTTDIIIQRRRGYRHRSGTWRREIVQGGKG